MNFESDVMLRIATVRMGHDVPAIESSVFAGDPDIYFKAFNGDFTDLTVRVLLAIVLGVIASGTNRPKA